MIKTDYHERVSEFGAIVGALIIISARHIKTTGAKSKNIGAAVLISLKGLVSFGEEVDEITLPISDATNNTVDPENKNNNSGDDEKSENT